MVAWYLVLMLLLLAPGIWILRVTRVTLRQRIGWALSTVAGAVGFAVVAWVLIYLRFRANPDSGMALNEALAWVSLAAAVSIPWLVLLWFKKRHPVNHGRGSTQGTAGSPSASAARTFSLISALAVGLICWGITIVLLGGVPVVGNPGRVEAFLFFTPVLGFALPLAVAAFRRDRSLLGIWIVASAPILSVLNLAIVLVVFQTLQPGRAAELDRGLSPVSALAVIGGWLLLLALVLAMAPALRRSD